MPRNHMFAILLLLATMVYSAASVAGERIALVIGNSNYEHVGRLPNPKNDAELMTSSLEKAGFTVTKLIDVNYRTLKRSIIAFGRKLRESPEAGLFYYAGHGVQVRGENYLIPVDANITDEDEVDLEAVNVNSFLRVMRASNSDLNIVVLDACRDNPFARSFRSSSRGLATVDAPRGTYIAYSTAPGNVAADGDGENSPYTLALAKSIDQRGAKIEDVFKNARKIVLKSTKNKQVPWETSSITGDFYFHKAVEKKPVVVKLKPVVSSLPNNVQQAGRVYGQIKNTSSVSVLGIFADQYKGTIYARFALARIKELKAFGAEKSNAIVLPKKSLSAAERGWNAVRFSELESELEAFASKYYGTKYAALSLKRMEKLRKFAVKKKNSTSSNNNKDAQAAVIWKKLQFSENLQEYREFSSKFSTTKFAEYSNMRIATLENEFNGNNAEKTASSRWSEINSIQSDKFDKTILSEFAQKFPNTKYAGFAQQRIQQLTKYDQNKKDRFNLIEKEAEQQWNVVSSGSNTDIPKLQRFALEYGTTRFATFARNRIAYLESKPERKTTSYTQYEREAERQWNIVSAGRNVDVAALRRFSIKYGTTRFAIFALNRIAYLENKTVRKTTSYTQYEREAERQWNNLSAGRNVDVAGLRRFSIKYSTTRFATFARNRIAYLASKTKTGKTSSNTQYEREAERQWNNASSGLNTDIAALTRFSKKYSTTKFAAFARNRIAFLESKKFDQDAERIWNFLNTSSKPNIVELRDFVQKYPKTRYAKYAHDKINYLVNHDNSSEETWRKLQNSNNLPGLEKLIKDFPNSIYAKYANDRIDLIEHAERIRQSSAAKGRLRQTSIAKKRSRKIRLAGSTENKKIFNSKRWTAYQRDHDKGTSCNTQARPLNRKTGAVSSFFISNWLYSTKKGDTFHVPSALFLKKRLPVSNFTVEISGREYLFNIQNKYAFPKDYTRNAEMVEAMKLKRRFTSKTTAKNGRVYTDTFSLSGVTKTLARVDQRCPAIIE